MDLASFQSVPFGDVKTGTPNWSSTVAQKTLSRSRMTSVGTPIYNPNGSFVKGIHGQKPQFRSTNSNKWPRCVVYVHVSINLRITSCRIADCMMPWFCFSKYCNPMGSLRRFPSRGVSISCKNRPGLGANVRHGREPWELQEHWYRGAFDDVSENLYKTFDVLLIFLHLSNERKRSDEVCTNVVPGRRLVTTKKMP